MPCTGIPHHCHRDLANNMVLDSLGIVIHACNRVGPLPISQNDIPSNAVRSGPCDHAERLVTRKVLEGKELREFRATEFRGPNRAHHIERDGVAIPMASTPTFKCRNVIKPIDRRKDSP